MTSTPSSPIYSIYLITNLVNNKKYVGFTSQNPPEKRWLQHCRTNKPGVSTAIKKYGKTNFTFEVILQGRDMDDILNMEKYFIKEYNTLGALGYNLTTGGVRYLNPDLVQLKKSKSMTGKILSDSHRKKISDSNKGKVMTLSQRKHLSEIKMGGIPWNKGIKFSKEDVQIYYKDKYKKYIIELPSGDIIEIQGLTTFCQKQNICHKNLHNTFYRNSSHKGYKIIKKLS